MSHSLVRVVAFVDWNTQIRAAKKNSTDEPEADRVMTIVVKSLKEGLRPFLGKFRFEVSLRLYYGWHKGFSATPRRKELSKFNDEDLFSISSEPNIVLRSLAFGDRSLSGLEKRIIPATGSHFPATCRDRGNGQLEEKMVDTALVSDLVYCAARSDDDSWLIVLGEDIDLMPGVYAAEALLQRTDRRLAYLRKRPEKFLNCADLQVF